MEHSVEDLERMLNNLMEERRILNKKIRKHGATEYDKEDIKAIDAYAKTLMDAYVNALTASYRKQTT
jgi:hypothetical protein